jgi:hypothetical protein
MDRRTSGSDYPFGWFRIQADRWKRRSWRATDLIRMQAQRKCDGTCGCEGCRDCADVVAEIGPVTCAECGHLVAERTVAR